MTSAVPQRQPRPRQSPHKTRLWGPKLFPKLILMRQWPHFWIGVRADKTTNAVPLSFKAYEPADSKDQALNVVKILMRRSSCWTHSCQSWVRCQTVWATPSKTWPTYRRLGVALKTQTLCMKPAIRRKTKSCSKPQLRCWHRPMPQNRTCWASCKA